MLSTPGHIVGDNNTTCRAPNGSPTRLVPSATIFRAGGWPLRISPGRLEPFPAPTERERYPDPSGRLFRERLVLASNCEGCGIARLAQRARRGARAPAWPLHQQTSRLPSACCRLGLASLCREPLLPWGPAAVCQGLPHFHLKRVLVAGRCQVRL